MNFITIVHYRRYNSKLVRIDNFVFKKYTNLYSITLPDNVYIVESSFEKNPVVKHFGDY